MLKYWSLGDRKPSFCTKCGKQLEAKELTDGYNAYTGEIVVNTFLMCNEARLNYSEHDAWRVEPYDEEMGGSIYRII